MDIVVSESRALTRASAGKADQPLWKVLTKSTIIFVGTSFLAFGVINAKALYQQFSDSYVVSKTTTDLLTDNDGDGLPDWWEKDFGFDAEAKGDEVGDPDEEGLFNINEFVFSTNPLEPDTDGDGFDDYFEIKNFFDPTSSGGTFLDLDRDGLPDWWEEKFGLNLKADDSKQDIDNDELINEKEYKYGTDPRNPDTDGDGFSDGREVASNFNPLGEGRLDSDGDGLSDTEERRYRSDPNNADSDGDRLSDGVEVNEYGSNPTLVDTDRDGFDDGDEVDAGFDPTQKGARLNLADRDEDELTLEQEEGIGTDPENPDTDGDGFNDGTELRLGLDPTNSDPEARASGRLIVDKIGIGPPVVWVQENTQEAYQKGLESGVIHVPGTAYPGQIGNAYVTGHSSDYAFKPGEYKDILSRQADLEIGDEVQIEMTFSNGRKALYTYKMYQKDIVQPDNPILFQVENKPVLTLATCWPLNTSWKRLMQKYDLVATEYR